MRSSGCSFFVYVDWIDVHDILCLIHCDAPNQSSCSLLSAAKRKSLFELLDLLMKSGITCKQSVVHMHSYEPSGSIAFIKQKETTRVKKGPRRKQALAKL